MDHQIGQPLCLRGVALDAGIKCAVEHADDGRGVGVGKGASSSRMR